MALDLACDLGRHALWLADRHWQVSGVDLSDVAIGKLSQAALAAYLTWQGRMLENNGIVPKFSIELSREALKQEEITNLEPQSR
jgi:hypothetical protein